MPGYYLVRARAKFAFEEFKARSVVGVGWSLHDFSKIANGHDVRHVLESDPEYINTSIDQATKFKDIKKGDKILVPVSDTKIFLAAIATGKEIYVPEFIQGIDLSNLKEVDYAKIGNHIREIDRSLCSKELQNQLQLIGSICISLNDFKEEIDKFI